MKEVRKVETADRQVFTYVPPAPGSWYCPDCKVLHVTCDECPDTKRKRGDR